MEIDTASAVTLLSASDFSKLGDHIETLKSPTVILKSYTGNIIECLGEKEMELKIGDQLDTLLVRVVKGPSILGRDLMAKFKLLWQNIFHMVSTTSEDIVSQYPKLFDNTTVGKLKDIQVPLRVKEANPLFIKPRVVPFAIRSKYEDALEKLVAEDIIEKVEHSEWASPTVPIVKPNGDLRICGDYSVTRNKFLVMEQYPIPSLEELLSKLSGGKRFTKIDLSQAYHQLELTPESRKYTSTRQGLYQYKCLTYGVTSAVSIFQRTIENVLKDLPGCCVRIDDILVSGGTDEIHLENLHHFLSRRPIEADPSHEEQVTVNVMFIERDQFVNASIVASETKRDPVLSKEDGILLRKPEKPEKPEPVFQPYHNKRLKLTKEDGILLWNSQVIVPEVLRTLLLNDLHTEHLGMIKMKQLARRYLWWPGLDKEIEETVKLCHSCQEAAKTQPAPNPASWSWPGGPWKRLHLDFAGPYLPKMYLVIVDAYSKFVEVVPMGQATTTNTIAALRRVFSLPEHLVTDNGSQFASAEFQNFLKVNDIEHTLTAQGHPATNSLVERYVGEFKDKLNKIGDTGETVQTKLDSFLLTLRATPTSLGKSPSELLMNRQPRIRFRSLRFKTSNQEVKVFQHNLDNKPKFKPEQSVFVRNFGKGAKWVPGRITETVSPRNFNVQVGDCGVVETT
ncbi:PREDICTED: uncharacterized protein K02A2.6-like [Acropora digitifera]|uniref:uncharacterized protein K02A2.6-like n=1 Tax=Acropora digitifera TaxID=70779 RepID=UPI00077ACA17|nr:PREDICTED: uncharacterized protein K02A2.6-like [Acropora digitifera]